MRWPGPSQVTVLMNTAVYAKQCCVGRRVVGSTPRLGYCSDRLAHAADKAARPPCASLDQMPLRSRQAVGSSKSFPIGQRYVGMRIFCPGKIRSGSLMTSLLASKIFG